MQVVTDENTKILIEWMLANMPSNVPSRNPSTAPGSVRSSMGGKGSVSAEAKPVEPSKAPLKTIVELRDIVVDDQK